MQQDKPDIWAEAHLNAIRGLAALVVVLGHARGLLFPALTTGTGGAGPHPNLGHEAVMIFFVLSGYLVGGSVLRAFRRGAWSWRNYLIKRLVRLWIVLIPAIALGIALDSLGAHLFGGAGSLYGAPPGQDYVLPGALAGETHASTILGNILFVQTILVPPVGTNVPLWSLANEFWYYLAFPLGLIALHPSFRPIPRLVSGLAVLAILVFIGWYADVQMLPWLMGALVSQIRATIPARFRIPAAWAAAAGMAATMLAAKSFIADLLVADLIVGLAAAILIYVVTRQDQAGETGFYGRVSGWLAGLSYTLYLTHLPFLIFLFSAVSGPWVLHPISAVSLAELGGLVAAALLWAWGLYWLFEARTEALRRLVA